MFPFLNPWASKNSLLSLLCQIVTIYSFFLVLVWQNGFYQQNKHNGCHKLLFALSNFGRCRFQHGCVETKNWKHLCCIIFTFFILNLPCNCSTTIYWEYSCADYLLASVFAVVLFSLRHNPTLTEVGRRLEYNVMLTLSLALWEWMCQPFLKKNVSKR